ncbi:hypothetical protein HK104_010919 [Borealophlyctis nickersoniae]|nr:hypothetical protein HK104_010919 [Borealophlyctis nickersoniae]
MPSTFTLSQLPYAKLLFHAAKYAVNPVCGVLVGSRNGRNVAITDAIPLFHSHPLAPSVEIALHQVDIYCSSTGQSIVGFYCANESTAEQGVVPAMAKIAAKVEESASGDTVLLLLDPTKLTANSAIAVVPYTYSSGSWKVLQPNNFVPQPADIQTPIAPHIKDRTYEQLYDFDNHLDNVRLDWLKNAEIVQAIKL